MVTIDASQMLAEDFSIKGCFLITSVKRKMASNNTQYYSVKLEHKRGILKAIRFTNNKGEFELLSQIYFEDNIIEIEGTYRFKWNSIKINNEKLIVNSIENSLRESQNNHIENILKKELAQLKELVELGTTIQIKSYINAVVKSIFNNQSKRKIRQHKRYLQIEIDSWPIERREEINHYYNQAFERYESLQPSKLKKFGSFLLKSISVLR